MVLIMMIQVGLHAFQSHIFRKVTASKEFPRLMCLPGHNKISCSELTHHFRFAYWNSMGRQQWYLIQSTPSINANQGVVSSSGWTLLFFSVNPYVNFLIKKRHKASNSWSFCRRSWVPPYNVMECFTRSEHNVIIVRYSLRLRIPTGE